MSLRGPYRPLTSSSWTEEELWLRLDDALVVAVRDPVLAWGIAWQVACDSGDFPEVRTAAGALMEELFTPLPGSLIP